MPELVDLVYESTSFPIVLIILTHCLVERGLQRNFLGINQVPLHSNFAVKANGSKGKLN